MLRANHICHVGRMEEVRFLKQVLFGELKLGKKKQSKPKQRWNDNIRKDMKKLIIDGKSWCQETEYWYCLTMDKAVEFNTTLLGGEAEVETYIRAS